MDVAQIAPVVIGGVVTLIVTFIVQVFVIPEVQARVRRRERWESDVLELAALLAAELRPALDGYRSAAYRIRYMKRMLRDPTYDQEKVEALWHADQTELRQADKAVGELMSRLMILESRIRRRRPRAPLWDMLYRRAVLFQVTMPRVTTFPTDEPDPLDDDDRWAEAWDRVRKDQQNLRDLVEKVAGPMKPPPRRLLHRAKRRVKRWVARRQPAGAG